MALKLCALIILMLSSHLAPIIHAGKPVLAKSAQQIVSKSESITTIASPTIKHVQHKNTGFRKLIGESLAKKVDAHGTGSSTNPIEVTHESSSFSPWNSYANHLNYPLPYPMPNFPSIYDGSPFSPISKFMPFFGYSQPLFIPYPVMMPTSDMFYPSYTETQTNSEDTMSRTSTAARRPIHSSNSPIYYFRMPPPPYMFMPSFNYAPTPFLPYSPLSAIHALPMGSMLNLPMNFLANGKPNGIYRIDGTPNELSHNPRPTQFNNPFRPISFSLPSPTTTQSQFSFPSSSSSSSSNTQHDSKMNTFKNPFVFNGRPEDMYILPNNLSPSIYSENSFF